jgi:hypothetical protein
MKAIDTDITKKGERVKQKIIIFIRRNFGYYLLQLFLVLVAIKTPLQAEGKFIAYKNTESINSGFFPFEIHNLGEDLSALKADAPVSGIVRDENGTPLPGASVTVAGTTTGTVTDINGKYTLNVDEGAKLIFSYIGFNAHREAVGNRSQ